MEFDQEIEDVLSDTDSDLSCQLEFEIDTETQETDGQIDVIEPYRFEPYLDDEEQNQGEASSSEDEGETAEAPGPQIDMGRLQNTNWYVYIIFRIFKCMFTCY